MSAKDIVHEAVKNALTNEGWQITHDPLYLQISQIRYVIDLGAEKLIAAEKADRKIAVEIKSFIGPSATSEFHTALGQFLNYTLALEREEPDRTLYLAVPLDTYDEFFTLPLIQLAVQRYQLKLLVFSAEREVIVQWLE